MSIAMLINNYPPAIGGAELYAERLATEIAAATGSDVEVFTRSFKNAPAEQNNLVIGGNSVGQEDFNTGYVNIHRISTTKVYGIRFIAHSLSTFWKMYRMRDKIELIHAFHVFSTGFMAVLIGKMMGRPVVIRDGQSLSSVKKYLDNRLYRRIIKYTLENSSVYVDNPELKKMFESVFQGQVSLLLNPVDTEKFHPRIRKKYGKFVVGYIGRVEPFKGIWFLAESIGFIGNLIPNIKLAIVGDGSQLNDIKTAFGENYVHTKNRIDFKGSLPFDDIQESFQSLDVFVQPSLTAETPNSVLQAMATGLPIIATKLVASHILKDRKNCLVIDEFNAFDIKDKLIELYKHKRLARKLAKNARKTALDKLSWWNHVQEILHFYNNSKGVSA